MRRLYMGSESFLSGTLPSIPSIFLSYPFMMFFHLLYPLCFSCRVCSSGRPGPSDSSPSGRTGEYPCLSTASIARAHLRRQGKLKRFDTKPLYFYVRRQLSSPLSPELHDSARAIGSAAEPPPTPRLGAHYPRLKLSSPTKGFQPSKDMLASPTSIVTIAARLRR